MASVGFTIGEGAGKLIVDIAQEQLIYHLNPLKAMASVSQSLVGCDDETAKRILFGEVVLTENVKEQCITGERYHPEKHKGYPRFDITGWCDTQMEQIRDSALSWREAIRQIRLAVIKEGGKFSFTIGYKELIQYFWDGTLMEFYDSDEAVEIVRQAVVGIRNFLEKVYHTHEVILWLRRQRPDYVPNGYESLHPYVKGLNDAIFELMSGDDEVEGMIRKVTYQQVALKKYVDSEIEIRHNLSKGIRPVNIEDGYDAGWLSPTGDFYGLNGEIANMLHNSIADALLSAGVICTSPTDKRDYTSNPDSWLENHGWAKVSRGGWILYCGYDLKHYHLADKNLPMTKAQQKAIYRYGQKCCDGRLKLGYNYEIVSAARFEMTDSLMLKKYFSLH